MDYVRLEPVLFLISSLCTGVGQGSKLTLDHGPKASKVNLGHHRPVVLSFSIEYQFLTVNNILSKQTIWLTIPLSNQKTKKNQDKSSHSVCSNINS